MAYAGLYSVVIRSGGIVRPEEGGVVTLPFGSEYEFYAYNGTSTRAVARIFVDGLNVSDGGLVIRPYGFASLECPTSGTTARFKLAAEDSDAAAAHGKGLGQGGPEKGVVRVEFHREVPPPPIITQEVATPRGGTLDFADSERSTKTCGIPTGDAGTVPCSYSPRGAMGGGETLSARRAESATNRTMGFSGAEFARRMRAAPTGVGVTVAGSASAQRFRTVALATEPTGLEVVLRLRGFVAATAAPSPLPQARTCECGTALSPLSNFCGYCGRGR